MTAPVYIGDEISAAGFRLAGVRIRTPKVEAVSQTMDWASTNSSLIILSESLALALPDSDLSRYLRQVYPPVIVLPDIRMRRPGLNLLEKLKSQLGVLE